MKKMKTTKRTAVLAFLALNLLLGAAWAQKEKAIYAFTGGADGAYPYGGVIFGAKGRLYGTTYQGGTAGYGTVFTMTASGKETVLHNFTSQGDGALTLAGLVSDAKGNLYGTTYWGGGGAGTVFKITPSGKEKVIYKFSGIPDGANPNAALVIDVNGNLYGTTLLGGANNLGTVFKVTPSGKETVLYSFTGNSDGAQPFEPLAIDKKNNLYGTTSYYSSGNVFEVSPSGQFKVLLTFDGGQGGYEPNGQLVLDAKGNIYGTTFNGGAYGQGIVFKLARSGTETVLHNFDFSDGANPAAGMVFDAKGNLYGTTFSGGANLAGNVFKISRSGTFTVLYNFTGGADGGYPQIGTLVFDKKGALYDTTPNGGAYGFGTVFKLVP